MADLRPVYVAGDGDVKGPASASNNFLPLFADTTGKLLKSSGTGVTTQGLAILDDNTPAEQRNTIGLDQVNNTSDINKPVSTAQQTALNLKQDKLLYIPVQQGGGIGQTPTGENKVYIGWSASGGLKVTVDTTDQGNIVFDRNTATEASAGVIRISTAQQALDWTDDSTAMTPIKVKASMDKKLPFVPVQQGGGLGQGSNNKLYLGFNIAARRPSIVVDAQNYGGIAFTGDIPVQATESTLGVLKLATIAEIIGGVDTLSAVNPAGLKALFPKRSFSGRDYIRIPDVPGGLIIQWVVDAPEATSASDLIAFPVPFPKSLLGVSATLNAKTSGGLGQTTNIVVSSGRSEFQYTSGGSYGGGGVAYVLAWGC